MCGRFGNAVPSREYVPYVQRHYPGLDVQGWANEAEQDQWRPRHNICPRSNVPVIRREGGQNVVRVMNWALVPHWTKHENPNDRLKTINARSESLTGEEERSSLWASLAPSKRCLIPVEGFFEWLTKGKGKAGKTPFYIRNPAPSSSSGAVSSSAAADDAHATSDSTDGQSRDIPPLMFAGLWDSVTYEETDTPLLTFTILTTSSSKPLQFLHTRMPCLLRTEVEMQAWLDCEPVPKSQAAAAAKEGRNQWSKELAALLKPYGETADDIVRYAVPQEVGKVGTESASFVHPVAERKDGIDAFFKQAFAKGAKPLAGPGTAGAVSSSTTMAGGRKSKSASPEKKPDVKAETTPVVKDEKAAEAAFAGDRAAAAAKSGAASNKKGKGKAKAKNEEAGEVVLSDEDDEVVVVDSSPPPSTAHSPPHSLPIMVHSSSVNRTASLPEWTEETDRSKPRRKSDALPQKKRKSDEYAPSTVAERRKKKGKIDGYFTKEE